MERSSIRVMWRFSSADRPRACSADARSLVADWPIEPRVAIGSGRQPADAVDHALAPGRRHRRPARGGGHGAAASAALWWRVGTSESTEIPRQAPVVDLLERIVHRRFHAEGIGRRPAPTRFSGPATHQLATVAPSGADGPRSPADSSSEGPEMPRNALDTEPSAVKSTIVRTLGDRYADSLVHHTTVHFDDLDASGDAHNGRYLSSSSGPSPPSSPTPLELGAGRRAEPRPVPRRVTSARVPAAGAGWARSTWPSPSIVSRHHQCVVRVHCAVRRRRACPGPAHGGQARPRHARPVAVDRHVPCRAQRLRRRGRRMTSPAAQRRRPSRARRPHAMRCSPGPWRSSEHGLEGLSIGGPPTTSA